MADKDVFLQRQGINIQGGHVVQPQVEILTQSPVLPEIMVAVESPVQKSCPGPTECQDPLPFTAGQISSYIDGGTALLPNEELVGKGQDTDVITWKTEVFLDPILHLSRWSYYPEGGNGFFRVTVSDMTFDSEKAIKEEWTLVVLIDGQIQYRGLITKVARERIGQEEFWAIEGTGGIIFMNRIMIRRSFSFVKIKDIVKFVVSKFLNFPASPLIFRDARITAGDYVVQSLNYRGPVIRLFKLLAETEKNVAWGVDHNFEVYFKPKDPTKEDEAIFIEDAGVDIADWLTTDGESATEVITRGEDLGNEVPENKKESTELITGISRKERFEENAAFSIPADTDRWSETKLEAFEAAGQDAATFKLAGGPRQFDADRIPFRLSFRDNEGTFREFQIQRLVFQHGGIAKGQGTDWAGGSNTDFNASHYLRTELFCGKWGRDIVEHIETIDAKLEQVRMRDSQRQVPQSPMILRPLAPLAGAAPGQVIRGRFVARRFLPNQNQSLVYQGGISGISNSRATELVIRIRFILTAGLAPSERIVLRISWQFPFQGQLITTQDDSRRTVISDEFEPLSDLSAPFEDKLISYDAVFILRKDIKVGTDINVVVERLGADLEDDSDVDFDLESVTLVPIKRLHTNRVNSGRANVNEAEVVV